MKKVIIFPGKYIQGEGVLREAGRYIGIVGRRPVLLWGKRAREAVKATLIESLGSAGLEFVDVPFNGECTKAEARRVADAALSAKADAIVGIGGGKVMDTAKGAAALTSLRTVMIPTIASNDAPTSACTVWHNDAGKCVGFDLWKFNPDIVLVDTGVVAKAPVRFFVAGMGDALATWPEANAAGQSQAVSCAGGVPTMTVMALARLCFDTLMQFGVEARDAVEKGVVTPAVEKVVEANVLLSGVGWESGGLACAHAIANALPAFSETHHCLHGEKVAFGLMSQMCLDKGMKKDTMLPIVDFMAAVGLPITFAELGLHGFSPARLRDFARIVASKGSFVHNHNFEVTAASVADAMVAADALGNRRKRKSSDGTRGEKCSD